MVKRNNPANIRFNAANKWKGQIGHQDGFCIFDTVNNGVRAQMKLIKTYIRKGFDTVEKIITRWSPPNENDTKNIIKFICDKLGIEPDTKISFDNGFVICEFCYNQIRIESGVYMSSDLLCETYNELIK